MKLTESVLRQMVKEELEAVLAEAEEGESIYDRAKKIKSTSPHAAALKASIEASQKKRGKTVESEEERDKKAREQGRTLPYKGKLSE